jgi:hypothetical protein
MAEKEGFEPSHRLPDLRPFQGRLFSRLSTSPKNKIALQLLLNYCRIISVINLEKIKPLIYDIRGLAWQRPTLTGVKPQLPSALRSLTSVFGMGTGVTFSPLLPDHFIEGLFPQN